MRAAIYARYSSENQRESSIEDQVREYREEAARLGYLVGRVFTDARRSSSLIRHAHTRVSVETTS